MPMKMPHTFSRFHDENCTSMAVTVVRNSKHVCVGVRVFFGTYNYYGLVHQVSLFILTVPVRTNISYFNAILSCIAFGIHILD